MDYNNETLALVQAHFADDARSLDDLTDERWVLVCSEGLGKHIESVVGGVFRSVDAALENYDWLAGVPEYLIDLSAGPADAVVDLAIAVAPAGDRASLEDRGVF